MTRDRIEVDRETLYEQVWSTPMIQLAKEYRLSDRGLAKVCERLQVPVRGRGYWDEEAAGGARRAAEGEDEAEARGVGDRVEGID